MKFNLFIASVLVSQTLGFRMLRRANDWKERGLSGMERLNQIRLQREGEKQILHVTLHHWALIQITRHVHGICSIFNRSKADRGLRVKIFMQKAFELFSLKFRQSWTLVNLGKFKNFRRFWRIWLFSRVVFATTEPGL